MKRYAVAALLVISIAAIAFWWFSPAQVVKRRCQTLLRTLTLEPGSGNAGRQMGTYSLNALLAAEDAVSAARGRLAQDHVLRDRAGPADRDGRGNAHPDEFNALVATGAH